MSNEIVSAEWDDFPRTSTLRLVSDMSRCFCLFTSMFEIAYLTGRRQDIPNFTDAAFEVLPVVGERSVYLNVPPARAFEVTDIFAKYLGLAIHHILMGPDVEGIFTCPENLLGKVINVEGNVRFDVPAMIIFSKYSNGVHINHAETLSNEVQYVKRFKKFIETGWKPLVAFTFVQGVQTNG